MISLERIHEIDYTAVDAPDDSLELYRGITKTVIRGLTILVAPELRVRILKEV